MSAQVLQLDEWRPRPHGWEDLAWIDQTDKRDAIRIYDRQGLHPILLHGLAESGICTCGRSTCPGPGKHPVEKGWQSTPFDLAALDERLIENWRFNIGLKMGRQPSGVVLITIDVDGPRSLLEPIEKAEGMEFPPTLTAKTARGLHMVYRWPENREPPTNRANLSPKVDVRAVGGQIVAPPSTHASGVRYRWIDTRAPEVLP